MDLLLDAAKRGFDNAFAPYSHFQVGAGLRAHKDGGEAIFSGCNVENATYGLTLCAERVAIFKAVSEGFREFSEIVIFTAASEPTPPCGACRQIIWEFCGDIQVTAWNTAGGKASWRMSELMPHAFSDRSMG